MKTSVVAALLLCFGSESSVLADESAFRASHPGEAVFYKLYRTSIEAESYHAKELYICEANLHCSLEDVIPQAGSEKLRARIKKMENTARIIWNDSNRAMELISKAQKDGDELYIYNYKNGANVEEGYLLLRKAEILEKWPFFVGTENYYQPNHLLDPTSSSATPPAAAGGAPSVAADH